MRIYIDEDEIYSLSETQKKVIKNDINEDEFDADIKRRLRWSLEHKYDQCFDRLKKEWEPKLSGRVQSIPTDKDAFANLVFSQSDYKDKKSRESQI